VHLGDKIRTTEEKNMNKRFRFSRLCGFFLALISFTIGGWTVSASSLADPIIPGAWTKYATNPVLSPGSSGSWDDQWVFGSGVILDGSTYKMWYTSYSAASTTKKIGYATSTNGLGWNKSTNPVLSPGATGAWDAKGVYYAAVIKDGTTYKMWYTGVNASNIGQVGYATSPNGTAWTKYAGNPVVTTGSWDSTYVGQVSVIKIGSTYYMWYRGGSSTGGAIGYATSPDGITWTKGPIAIDGGSGDFDTTPASPEVIFDGTTYHMFYTGCDNNWENCQQGYATSGNGTTWTRQGTILPMGASGTWDDSGVEYASVVLAGTTLKMWYNGYDGASSYPIGYASAPVKILDKSISLPLIRNYHNP
jgi:predicted GH43/DUF377 family glycosyl hydrolase